MLSVPELGHEPNVGLKLLDPSTKCEAIVSLLVEESPLLSCEGAHHVP